VRRDLLREILQRAECTEPVFSFDEVRRWQPGDLERLSQLGLLRETEPAGFVACDACGDWHIEEVLWQPSVREPSGQRAYVRCPVEGIVHVPAERVRQWVIDSGALARQIALAMELSGHVDSIVAGSLWKLGRRRLVGRFRDIFFFSSSSQPPGTDLTAHLSAPSGVLLTLGSPQRVGWRMPDFTLFDVKEVARLDVRGLEVDLDYIEDALLPARPSEKLAAIRSVALPAGNYGKELTLEEAGFLDTRQSEAAGDRTAQILRLFAQRRGCIALDALPAGDGELARFRKQVSALRTRLKALFAIDDEPIPFNKMQREYRCAFEVRISADNGFPTPAGATWLSFRIEERAGGRIAIGLATGATFRARTEVAERQEWTWRDYLLDALGLASADGRPTAEGRVLLACLRHGGRIERPPDDSSVLKLGRTLREWTGLPDDPFSYGVDARAWIARFECGAANLH
jgi:hypothetical protein